MKKLVAAIAFAADKHRNQRRKDEEASPYINHPIALADVLANEAGRAGGTVLFDLRLDTAVFAVAFSTILGMLAGIIPAWSAARLDPVTALRYE